MQATLIYDVRAEIGVRKGWNKENLKIQFYQDNNFQSFRRCINVGRDNMHRVAHLSSLFFQNFWVFQGRFISIKIMKKYKISAHTIKHLFYIWNALNHA